MKPELREIIGETAYNSWRGNMFIEWKKLHEPEKERWRLTAEEAVESYQQWVENHSKAHLRLARIDEREDME